MQLEYVPLLSQLRELYRIPRGPRRFEEYIRLMVDRRNEQVVLPLMVMNPMAKDHLAARLDELIDLDADAIAAEAVAEAEERTGGVPGRYRVALNVADDVGGGWTNRWAVEHGFRFGEPLNLPGYDWLIGLLWASEPATRRNVREAILTSVGRTAYVLRNGVARTLSEKLVQEGDVLAWAGCEGPTLDIDDLDYTREVIGPCLDADDMRTAIECLFCDDAARSLGFTPRGLSPMAGLALARHEAWEKLDRSRAGKGGRLASVR